MNVTDLVSEVHEVRPYAFRSQEVQTHIYAYAPAHACLGFVHMGMRTPGAHLSKDILCERDPVTGIKAAACDVRAWKGWEVRGKG